MSEKESSQGSYTQAPQIDWDKVLNELLIQQRITYHIIAFDVKNVQIQTLRNYMWLATVIMGGVFMLLKIAYESALPYCPITFLSVAFALAFYVFFLSIDTARGREDLVLPTTSPQKIYDNFEKEYKNELEMIAAMLDTMGEATKINGKERNRVAHSLRLISRLLVVSLICGVIGAVFMFFNLKIYSIFLR